MKRTDMYILYFMVDIGIMSVVSIEPPHEKTCFLHMQKPRCRSAAR